MKRKLDIKHIHTFSKCTLRFVLFLFIVQHLKQHFKTAFDLRVIVDISKSVKNVNLPKLRAAVSKVVDEFDISIDVKKNAFHYLSVYYCLLQQKNAKDPLMWVLSWTYQPVSRNVISLN